MPQDDNIQIEINNRIYSGFISINIYRSIQNLAGTFSFTTVTKGIDFPFFGGEVCKIYVNQVQVIDGFIERFRVVERVDEHFIVVSGRDKTCDLVDSTLTGEGLNFVAPITLPQITIKTFEVANITGIDIVEKTQTRSFVQGDIVTPMVGETIFGFLSRYCKKRQVLLTSDGFGNVVFTRSSNDILNTELVVGEKQSNIIEIVSDFDLTDRFNKYLVHSQDNPSAASTDAVIIAPEKSTHITGIATDDEIRASRQYNFMAATSLKKPDDQTADNKTIIINEKKDDTKQRAIWEANVRRAKSTSLTCKVNGFSPTLDGSIWNINRLVKVFSENSNIDSTMLIQSIQYSLSLEQGSTCYLSLITKDAFDLLEIQGAKRTKKASERFEGRQFAGEI